MNHNLSTKNSVINKFVFELRDVIIQNDRMRFRKNLERMGMLIAYEISKTLTYKEEKVETPLGVADVLLPADKVVLMSILRAGLPMHNGFLEVFDEADNGFISAYRSHHKDGSFDIRLQYATCPTLTNAVLILIDPMLATGSSIEKSLEHIKDYGQWKSLHIVTAIASLQGLEHINRLYPHAHVWMGALDDELTAKSYIVPGLGDAGDLAFGKKLQE